MGGQKGGTASATIEDESVGSKLRRSSSKRSGGPHTPVLSWKMEEAVGASSSSLKDCRPSARTLGASLWELESLMPHQHKMRRRRRRREGKLPQLNNSDASEPTSPVRPPSGSRLMRHVATSSDQKHKLADRIIGDLKSESPTSCNSSRKVPAFNQAITPTSSSDLNGRIFKSGSSIKTSSEWVKILNRIWSLEEQLSSSTSLVKTLKVELHRAHSRIQELMQERQTYRNEMDELMKRVSEDRVNRKNREKERIKEAIQSVKIELEVEKKLRQKSDTLNRKLAKQLSEMKSAFSGALNDSKSERNSHTLLEDLCDELANGILEKKLEEDGNHRPEESLCHISKIWTNLRSQMKIAEAHGEEAKENKIVERLTLEMTSFLQARRFYCSKNDGVPHKYHKNKSLRRCSLESVHLNGAASAPRDAEDDDSAGSDLHCFELNMDVRDNVNQSNLNHNGEETKRPNFMNEKLKGHEMCSLEQDNNALYDDNKMHIADSLRGNYSKTKFDGCKSQPLVSGDSQIPSSFISRSNHRHSSSEIEITESSSKLPETAKENSLKEKLLEARLEGRNARLRALRGSDGQLQQ